MFMNDQTRDTYNKVAKEWVENHWTYEEEKDLNLIPHLKLFIELVDGKDKVVLDLGSGGGRDSKYLHDHGINVIGVDYSTGMLEEARKRNPEIEFLEMDMRKLTFANNNFDGVWACASLLHLKKEELPIALAEIKRVLKLGGILFAAVKEWSDNLAKPDKYGQRFFAYYKLDEFQEKIAESGFKILDSGVNNWHWIHVFARAEK